jgi:hypothetical protein
MSTQVYQATWRHILEGNSLEVFNIVFERQYHKCSEEDAIKHGMAR